MKRGLKTTEALATLITGLAVLAGSIQGSLSPKWAAIAAAISVGGYSISRGLTKAGGAEAFPALAANEPPATHSALTADEQAQLAALQAKAKSSP